MPLVTSGLPTEVSLSIVDYNNEDSTTSIYFPPAFSTVEIITNVAAIEAVVAALTDGFIAGGGLSRRFNQTDDPDETGGPATSNVQRKGVFIFENEFGTFNTYQIPSIDRALVLPGTNKIDRTAAAVVAYAALMTGGLSGITGSRPQGGNGRNLVRLVDAYEDTVSRPNTRR